MHGQPKVGKKTLAFEGIRQSEVLEGETLSVRYLSFSTNGEDTEILLLKLCKYLRESQKSEKELRLAVIVVIDGF